MPSPVGNLFFLQVLVLRGGQEVAFGSWQDLQPLGLPELAPGGDASSGGVEPSGAAGEDPWPPASVHPESAYAVDQGSNEVESKLSLPSAACAEAATAGAAAAFGARPSGGSGVAMYVECTQPAGDAWVEAGSAAPSPVLCPAEPAPANSPMGCGSTAGPPLSRARGGTSSMGMHPAVRGSHEHVFAPAGVRELSACQVSFSALSCHTLSQLSLTQAGRQARPSFTDRGRIMASLTDPFQSPVSLLELTLWALPGVQQSRGRAVRLALRTSCPISFQLNLFCCCCLLPLW